MKGPDERTPEKDVSVAPTFSLDARVIPLTDVGLSGLRHPNQVANLIEGGATLIQLREKHLPANRFYEQAKKALEVAWSRGARIIINDRVDIAQALAADGVHLGQDDLPPEAARELLGNDKIIGYSTHNVEQAVQAARLPLDYLAIGPIFNTTSKNNPDPVVGLEGLRQVRSAVGAIPLVAIGGINHENALDVISAGADAVAVMAAILGPPNEIAERMNRLLRSLSVSL